MSAKSREYLDQFIARAKEHLPDWMYSQLHKMALPGAGGKASWQQPALSPLEKLALKNVSPATWPKIEDEDLKAIWASVNKWHRQAQRRKQPADDFAGVAATVAAEMKRRGIEVQAKSAPPEWIANVAHSGAMVAIMAPVSVRKQFEKMGLAELPNAEPDGYHVTMLYLGKAEDFPGDKRAAVEKAIAKVAKDCKPLDMKITGFGKFSPGKDGTPVYAVANAPGLSRLQASLEAALEPLAKLSEHGWVPHMTLGYLESGSPANVLDLPDLGDDAPGWTAGEVVISWAGKRKSFKLDGEKKSEDFIPILCAAPEKQVAYYLVARAGMKDAHDHRITREDIESGAYSYMDSQKLKFEHAKSINGKARLVENVLIPDDVKTFHGEKVEPGDWIAGIHYQDPKLWKLVISGDYGISWGGYAARVEHDE